jgi:SAM-dependent methyltransferase
MGDINQHRFVERHRSAFSGPFLEVGARDYGTTQDLRGLFPGEPYVGIDMSAGPGVDVVVDMTAAFEEVDRRLQGRRFGTIFCLSVLEHCEQPFAMADNMTRLLRPGGKIYVSVPFAWKFHGYPSDYWRFTHEGVKKLFSRLAFDGAGGRATRPTGESRPLDEDIGVIHVTGGWHRKRGDLLRGLSADALKLLARGGVLRWLAGYRYVLAPTMVDMIGVLRDPDSP